MYIASLILLPSPTLQGGLTVLHMDPRDMTSHGLDVHSISDVQSSLSDHCLQQDRSALPRTRPWWKVASLPVSPDPFTQKRHLCLTADATTGISEEKQAAFLARRLTILSLVNRRVGASVQVSLHLSRRDRHNRIHAVQMIWNQSRRQ